MCPEAHRMLNHGVFNFQIQTLQFKTYLYILYKINYMSTGGIKQDQQKSFRAQILFTVIGQHLSHWVLPGATETQAFIKVHTRSIE